MKFPFNFHLPFNIVETINGLLYVKPEKPVPKLSDIDRYRLRLEVSDLLFDVLAGKITVLKALLSFPKNTLDESVNVCFHILAHYEADEDFRKQDAAYKEEQDEYIKYIAKLLKDGESIPINIINEYNEYYEGSLVYPEINRETVIERLKKRINI